MKMDEGLDTGPMLSRAIVEITTSTTATSLNETLSIMGADLLLKTLDPYVEGSLMPVPQPEGGITYAEKLSKAESGLDWTQSATSLDCQIRAFTPWPGVYFEHNGTVVKVSKAEVIPEMSGVPGEVLDDQLTIACGNGAIRLQLLQRPGGTWLTPLEFLNGYDLAKGTQLSCIVLS